MRAASGGRTPMSEPVLDSLRHPQVAIHATSNLPAWLFSPDGGMVLWANPPGAALLDAPSPAALVGWPNPRSALAAEIAHLAMPMRIGAPARLARLRGFSVGIGTALTCSCARIELENRTS